MKLYNVVRFIVENGNHDDIILYAEDELGAIKECERIYPLKGGKIRVWVKEMTPFLPDTNVLRYNFEFGKSILAVDSEYSRSLNGNLNR